MSRLVQSCQEICPPSRPTLHRLQPAPLFTPALWKTSLLQRADWKHCEKKRKRKIPHLFLWEHLGKQKACCARFQGVGRTCHLLRSHSTHIQYIEATYQKVSVSPTWTYPLAMDLAGLSGGIKHKIYNRYLGFCNGMIIWIRPQLFRSTHFSRKTNWRIVMKEWYASHDNNLLFLLCLLYCHNSNWHNIKQIWNKSTHYVAPACTVVIVLYILLVKLTERKYEPSVVGKVRRVMSVAVSPPLTAMIVVAYYSLQ